MNGLGEGCDFLDPFDSIKFSLFLMEGGGGRGGVPVSAAGAATPAAWCTLALLNKCSSCLENSLGASERHPNGFFGAYVTASFANLKRSSNVYF